MTKKNENDGLDNSKTTEKRRFSDSLRGLADTLDSTLDIKSQKLLLKQVR